MALVVAGSLAAAAPVAAHWDVSTAWGLVWSGLVVHWFTDARSLRPAGRLGPIPELYATSGRQRNCGTSAQDGRVF